MSHPHSYSEDEDGPMLKPRPRGRMFDLSADSTPNSPPTPPSEVSASSASLEPPRGSTDGGSTPSRTRSILNLTSSTLFGIYQPTGYATDREEPSTPWGTGAQTPRDGSFDFTRPQIPDVTLHNGPNGLKKHRRRSTITQAQMRHQMPRRGFKGYVLPLVGRTVALFSVGVLYGLLITHLHDRQEIAPVKVDNLDRQSWLYLAFWGVAGVALGETLPYLDQLWVSDDDHDVDEADAERRGSRRQGDWLDVVRSIGAFVGIAFAIRRLPWQSTLQLSLTLALANPAVWYLIDRSPSGFLLSTFVALCGTAALLGINPALVPSPSSLHITEGHRSERINGSNVTAGAIAQDQLVLGLFSQESVGVATWIASVLFVSSVCFGNIGRRLAPQTM
ncbi:hypothetical protein B0A50_05139 [Salinomyces thailandicus]|uniref:INSIG domain-containing protein n=1 Tax=Salinomyces thailandicus TaxID=706561 RepID=A0A4U0TVJ2_9PEZI|nr:hypothetical protein B0A50_05139 [Salinomyces thailandica]